MSSALWSKIDLTGSDGGLDSCLALASIPTSLAAIITGSGYECKSLRDFATSLTPDDYIQALDEIWQKEETTKRVRAFRGRLHSAWKAACAAIDHVESNAPSSKQAANSHGSMDWEAPLYDADVEEMEVAWRREYKVSYDAYTTPGDPLVNRVYREFRKWSMTGIRVETWKSILHERQPEIKYETPLSSNCTIVENVGTVYVANTLLDYSWGLRVLANAWGRAGNCLVPSKTEKDTMVKMMRYRFLVR